jgi:hypothetical protein
MGNKIQFILKRNPGSVHVGFLVDKVALEQVFFRVVGFPLSVHHSTGAPLLVKKIKKLVIFITRLHNKP